MAAFEIDTYLTRSGAVDLWAVDGADVPKHPLAPEAARTLRYMQDIESHTVDDTIRRLSGFASIRLLETWPDRFANGGRNGNRSD